jgi:hypothetical protein
MGEGRVAALSPGNRNPNTHRSPGGATEPRRWSIRRMLTGTKLRPMYRVFCDEQVGLDRALPLKTQRARFKWATVHCRRTQTEKS